MNRRQATRSDWARWLLVAAMLGLGAVAIAMEWWTSCSTLLPNVGSEGTIEVCGEPGITDVPVIAALLVVLLLLLPDLAEVTLPGGIGLKRQVEAQRQRQEVLEQRLSLIAQSQQAHATSIGNVLSLHGLQEMIEDVVATRVRLRELEQAEAGQPGARVEVPAIAERERAGVTQEITRLSRLELLELARELVRRWRTLAPLVRLADAARATSRGDVVPREIADRLAALTDEELERLVNWRDAYASVIETVDQTRRAIVADLETLPRADIAAVTAVAQELEESARDLGILR